MKARTAIKLISNRWSINPSNDFPPLSFGYSERRNIHERDTFIPLLDKLVLSSDSSRHIWTPKYIIRSCIIKKKRHTHTHINPTCLLYMQQLMMPIVVMGKIRGNFCND